jgi:hypothetical protein
MMAAAGRGFRGTAGVGCTIAEAVGIRKQRSDCNQDKRATTAKKHDLPLTYQMVLMVCKDANLDCSISPAPLEAFSPISER